jgi:squalene-hopene/tetraprenyl-beta-curcumene cyclase
MKNKFGWIIVCIVCVGVLFFSCSRKEEAGKSGQAAGSYTFPLSLKKEMSHSLEISYNWLISQQLNDGSWKSDPAITSLALYALVEKPGYMQVAKLDDAIKKGYDYVRKFVKKDGAIYKDDYQSYSTSVALMAFVELGSREDKGIIEGAKKFLLSVQFDESDGIDPKNNYYGGIGYEHADEGRPDLSNTQLAIEALKASDEYEAKYKDMFPAAGNTLETKNDPESLCLQKALVFLARCQNAKEVNNMPYGKNDGGFRYNTISDASDEGKDLSHSYGSMTYAGVKSLLYANVSKSDVRVRRALEWIRKYYTVDENPQLGQSSLYYYYYTFSKCLNALGDNVITDAKGQNHYWREDITKKLISIQHEEGYWVNTDGRYMENVKDITTAYSIIALKYAIKGLNESNIL